VINDVQVGDVEVSAHNLPIADGELFTAAFSGLEGSSTLPTVQTYSSPFKTVVSTPTTDEPGTDCGPGAQR